MLLGETGGPAPPITSLSMGGFSTRLERRFRSMIV